jgi:hypothetical protein
MPLPEEGAGSTAMEHARSRIAAMHDRWRVAPSLRFWTVSPPANATNPDISYKVAKVALRITSRKHDYWK